MTRCNMVTLLLLVSQVSFAASVGYLGASNTVRVRDSLKTLCPNIVTFVEAREGANPRDQRRTLYPRLKARAQKQGAWPLDLLVISPSANMIDQIDGHLNRRFFVKSLENLIADANRDGVKQIALTNVGPKWPEPRIATTEFNALHSARAIQGKIDLWLDVHSPLEGDKPGVCAYCTRERRASHWTALGQARYLVSIYNQLWAPEWGDFALPDSLGEYENFQENRALCVAP